MTTHYMMLQRNLLYTAVTCAQKLVVLVGSPRAIGIAVKAEPSEGTRSGVGGLRLGNVMREIDKN